MRSLLPQKGDVLCTPGVSRRRAERGEMDVDLLSVAKTSACSVTTALSRTKYSSAVLEVLAEKTFQRDKGTGSDYAALVHHELTSREHTRSLYGAEF